MAAEEVVKAARAAIAGYAGVKHKGSVVRIGPTVARVRFLRAPRFKKGMTLYYPVPWDRLREGRKALSEPQLDATTNFATVASATGGWKLAYRLATIAKALKGKDYGGKKRVPGKIPTAAEIEAVLRMV